MGLILRDRIFEASHILIFTQTLIHYAVLQALALRPDFDVISILRSGWRLFLIEIMAGSSCGLRFLNLFLNPWRYNVGTMYFMPVYLLRMNVCRMYLYIWNLVDSIIQ
jgi:hypothetical protein